ncbi:MAG: hypothetical protein L0H79_09540 [Intrasporangium sp.]|uniref:hypothetical protein n=1 Tax=Intrasporangium sp. TaxID=1925024 RepID=UPI00264A495C|nr:hypothetical protein [Intrasporangium sp.]MDN5795976.1 hypothetical protein [Intrasporangium sp.]
MAEARHASWERWLSIGGSIVAPITAISTLLFYFGYVSTRAQYLFFGLDVDTVGLTTQDLVMRSGQPLLVPLIVLPLVAAVAVVLAHRLRPWLVSHSGAGMVVGGVLLAVGLGLIFTYPLVEGWPYYPLVTPLVVAAGGTVTAYVIGLRGAPVAARVGLWILVAAGVFWANATVAQWSGAGLAREQAAHLERLPQVVFDTKERLYLPYAGSVETALPRAEGQQFAYRYRGWRLLVQKGDRMFLVLCRQSGSTCALNPASPTLPVAVDGDVRLQFFAP